MCPNCIKFFRTPVSNKAHLGVVHVRRKIVDNTLVCSAGSGCDRVKIGVGKKTKTHTKCSHEEIVNLFVKTEAKKVRVNKKTDKHETGSGVEKDLEENISFDEKDVNKSKKQENYQ